jgi:hypothetical protein
MLLVLHLILASVMYGCDVRKALEGVLLSQATELILCAVVCEEEK